MIDLTLDLLVAVSLIFLLYVLGYGIDDFIPKKYRRRTKQK